MKVNNNNWEEVIKTEREAAFRWLYEEAYPSAARFVCRMGGSEPDARDVFHDALIVLYEKVIQEEVNIKGSPKAYLLGIVKNLWIRQFNEQVGRVGLKEDVQLEIPEIEEELSDRQSQLLRYLEQAGQKCLQILQAFYYFRWPMQEISREFGYKNVRSATVQKYKCLEKVREQVKTSRDEEIFA